MGASGSVAGAGRPIVIKLSSCRTLWSEGQNGSSYLLANYGRPKGSTRRLPQRVK
jgi:hypothetical protein